MKNEKENQNEITIIQAPEKTKSKKQKEPKKKLHNEMSFFEHLGELRKRILYSMVSILAFFLVSWAFVDKIYEWLAQPVLKFMPVGQKLAYTALTDPFMMYVKLSFISGIFIASPLVFYQLWLFISPGLYRNEKKMVFPFVLFTTVFFVSGGAFGYFVVFPWACKFFLEIGKNFTAIITIDKYFSLAFRVLIGISAVFELPVLAFLLAKLRIISASFLIKYFKYAVVGIFILAAVITPTPDMITQSIFAVPMLFLYLLSILIAKIVGPKPEEEEE